VTAILVAEDDPASRLLLVATLSKLGHDITAVSNGREAWAALEAGHFPIMISDWMMPEMDGLTLCRMLRAQRRPKYTYVLLLTALGGKENYLQGMDAGADDYLTKPFGLDHIRARLRVAERIVSLQEEVTTLSGLLPICAYCKKIRDDNQQWTTVESYVSKRTEASFSHGVCPECYERTIQPQLDALKLPPR